MNISKQLCFVDAFSKAIIPFYIYCFYQTLLHLCRISELSFTMWSTEVVSGMLCTREVAKSDGKSHSQEKIAKLQLAL